MTAAQGIDISNWNPVATPASLAGLSFAYCKATESANYTDGNFAANWAAIKTAGIVRGAYHFFHPDTDPAAQASYFLSVIRAQGLEPGDLLVVDSETAAPNLDSVTLAFLQTVHGQVPNLLLTYTDESLAAQMPATAAAFPELWVAWPSATATAPSSTGAWKTWRFWQNGQTGVDRDVYNGTAADLAAWIEQEAGPMYPMSYIQLPGLAGVWMEYGFQRYSDEDGNEIVTGYGVDWNVWTAKRPAGGAWGAPVRM